MIYGDRFIPDQVRLTGRPAAKAPSKTTSGKRYTAWERERIEELYEEGLSLREIAIKTNKSVHGLTRHLKRKGLAAPTGRTLEAHPRDEGSTGGAVFFKTTGGTGNDGQ